MLASNTRSFCLSLPSTAIPVTYHYSLFILCWRSNPSLCVPTELHPHSFKWYNYYVSFGEKKLWIDCSNIKKSHSKQQQGWVDGCLFDITMKHCLWLSEGHLSCGCRKFLLAHCLLLSQKVFSKERGLCNPLFGRVWKRAASPQRVPCLFYITVDNILQVSLYDLCYESDSSQLLPLLRVGMSRYLSIASRATHVLLAPRYFPFLIVFPGLFFPALPNSALEQSQLALGFCTQSPDLYLLINWTLYPPGRTKPGG